MNTKEVSRKTNLSYEQVRYAIRQGAITPARDYGQHGKAREFNYRDLVLLKLFARLRADGYRLEAIKKAIAAAAAGWQSDDPEKAGILFDASGGHGESFAWQANLYIFDGSSYKPFSPSFPMPRFLYDIRAIAQEVKV